MAHWTPLGYHPENKKDKTPQWAKLIQIVIAMLVLFFWVYGHLATGGHPRLFSVLFLVVLGMSPLSYAIFNWNNAPRRNWELMFLVFILGSVLFLILKP